MYRTEHYLLEAMLDGDSYSSVADKRRFSTVDNQLNRVSEVIGDGIIDGWDIVDLDNNHVKITSGAGLINKFYVESGNDYEFDLDDNGVFYFFAKHKVGVLGGAGPSSNVQSVEYSDTNAPLSVVNFSASTSGNSDILLSWNGNSESDLHHYLLEKSTDNITFTELSQIDDDDTSYLDEDNVENKTYYYRISAVDYSGNASSVVNASVFLPISSSLPPNPTDIIVAPGHENIHLLWKRPAAFDFDRIDYWKIAIYRLNTDDTEDPYFYNEIAVNKSDYDYRITGLTNGQKYQITIHTVDVFGRVSTGFVAKSIPRTSTGPLDVQDIEHQTEENNSGVSIGLSWSDGNDPYTHTTAFRFKVYITVDGGPESQPFDVPIGKHTYRLSLYTIDGISYNSIPENVLVTLRITSVDMGGTESYGNYTRFVTSEYAAPSAVTDLTGTFDYESGKLVFEWQNQPDTYRVNVVIQYQDVDDLDATPITVVDITTSKIHRYVLDTAQLNYFYTITVIAINTGGINSLPTTFHVTTVIPDDLPLPEIPQEIEYSEKDRHIVLRWSPPNNQLLTYFNIYRMIGTATYETDDWELIDTLPKTIAQFTDYGLENGITYSYYITCIDVYDRESLHLPDDVLNLNFVEAIPKASGILTHVVNFQTIQSGSSISLAWSIENEEFDGFEIFRSTNNLHTWEKIAGVDKSITNYVDTAFLPVNGYTIHYRVNKYYNDADISFQTTDTKPENSIPLGKVTTGVGSIISINRNDRRNINLLTDPITEYTNARLLTHRHLETFKYDPNRIDLRSGLTVTEWTTVDGRIFNTSEVDIQGTSYVLKVNNRIPSVFYTIDHISRRIVFAEPIVEIDPDTGEITGEIPTIELIVVGIEEVTSTLPHHHFDKLHAKQVQFGRVPNNQIPKLNHEGRIKELLQPNSFLLERYNNHTFIVSTDNTDTSKNLGNGTTFFCVAPANADIETVFDFSQYDNGSTVGFGSPIDAIETSDNIVNSGYFSGTTDAETFLTGKKSYRLLFEYTDNSPTRWVRIQTNAPTFKKNPVINLDKQLVFRVLSKSSNPVSITLGIREIQSTPSVGSNGGTEGTIEWVGITDTLTDNANNLVPIGITIKPSSEWQTIQIDPKQVPALSFEDGNDLLTTRFGTIEHLAITSSDHTSSDNTVDLYLDNFYQFNDKMVAGTSQGIQVSSDFGSTWETVRYSATPVHQFFKSIHNSYIWAISANEVFVATDVNNWFVATGTIGVQFIRDITEDNQGNVFISTDKGVFRLDIELIDRFSAFRQTATVNPYTNDCYALHHNDGGSGLDEILVSTELGIYKTIDGGESWSYSGLSTAGFPAFKILRTDDSDYNLVALTKKHLLRKLWSENDFSTLTNFEDDYQTRSLWDIQYFNDALYVTSDAGLHTSIGFNVNSATDTPVFDRLFPQLTNNGNPKFVFGINTVDVGDGTVSLYVGQENHLWVINNNQIITTKTMYVNKDIPSFYTDNTSVYQKHLYNTFNNCLVFHEQIGANQVVSASYLPRQVFLCPGNGWAHNNANTDLVIYKNGIAKWGDFVFDNDAILEQINALEADIRALPPLTDFNSIVPQSNTLLQSTLTNIQNIKSGGENGAPNITQSTIATLIADLTRLLSLIDVDLADGIDIPKFYRSGVAVSQRSENSLLNTVETRDRVRLLDASNIKIDTTNGTIDFSSAISQSTDLDAITTMTFGKYDVLEVSIFHTNISNTGELTHREIEDKLEYINTGLTSNLTRTYCDNLIKLGILLENKHPDLFSRSNTTNIQSQFYGSYTNAWYDIKNSTIDFNTVIATQNESQPRFINKVTILLEDPYYGDVVWFATDKGILSYDIDNDGSLQNNAAFHISNEYDYVSDIYENNGVVYAICTNKSIEDSKIFYTSDFGTTWFELETINLPRRLYQIFIINNVKIVSTSEGVFYSDNNFGTWFRSGIELSTTLPSDSPSKGAFNGIIRNFELDRILIAETQRWFYVSGSGIEFLSIGRATNNGLKNVNCVHRFKNLTYVATDKGLYSDANSVLSDTIQFGLEYVEGTLTESLVTINDICHFGNALYCAGLDGIIYRYTDDDENDEIGNEWKKYAVSDSTIHKIFPFEKNGKHYLLVISYNQYVTLDISQGSGVFG